MYVLKIFWEFIKQYKITCILYTILTLLSFPLESIIVPQIYSHFFEAINEKTKLAVFAKYFVLIFVVLVIVNVANFLTTYIESYMLPELNGYIINYIYKNLLQKYEKSITEIELGKIITRLSTIPQYLKEFVNEFCLWIFPRVLAILIINIYFFTMSIELGVISVILLIIFFYVNMHFFLSCTDISTERHKMFEKKNQYTQDRLANSFSIYSMGNLHKEIINYNNDTAKYTDVFKSNLYCLNKATIFTSILIVLIFMSLNSFSTYLFMKKRMSFTNLMAIFIIIIYYIPCILTINTTMPTVIHHYGALSAVDGFMQELHEAHILGETQIHKPLVPIEYGNIVINNLTFSYSKKSTLFKNFFLTIKRQEKVAIMGPSGNGKSTLIKLIMGYYPSPPNTIFIDNLDIHKYELSDLRRQISYVNQNSKLFNLSVLENIQYGNDMTAEQIYDACKKMDIENVFVNLRDGYQTMAGVEGGNLSGGQKQMIHILRCIFKKNKIVILDEPTSAIDKENKKNIIDAIRELSKHSTLIIITHDDDLLELVDRVIHIESGKITNDRRT